MEYYPSPPTTPDIECQHIYIRKRPQLDKRKPRKSHLHYIALIVIVCIISLFAISLFGIVAVGSVVTQKPLMMHLAALHPTNTTLEKTVDAIKLNVDPIWFTPIHNTRINGLGGGNLAYLLLVHNQNSLYSSVQFMQNSIGHFYIHLDAKFKPEITLLKAIELMFEPGKVTFVSTVDVRWGKVDMVVATIDTLIVSLQSTWNHIVILSGDSFPLKPQEEIARFLNLSQYNNVLFYSKPAKVCGYYSTGWEEHCKKQSGVCLDQSCSKMSSTPLNYPVYKGMQWIVLSRLFVTTLLRDSVAEDWLRFFGQSHASDEMFFQSYAMSNPLFSDSLVSANNHEYSRKFGLDSEDGSADVSLLYLHWNSWGGCRSVFSTQPWGWSPCQLGKYDLQDLLTSSALFARKFSPYDDTLVDVVKQWNGPLFRFQKPRGWSLFGLSRVWYLLKHFTIWHFDGVRDLLGHNLVRVSATF
jgi:hypothetical protein